MHTLILDDNYYSLSRTIQIFCLCVVWVSEETRTLDLGYEITEILRYQEYIYLVDGFENWMFIDTWIELNITFLRRFGGGTMKNVVMPLSRRYALRSSPLPGSTWKSLFKYFRVAAVMCTRLKYKRYVKTSTSSNRFYSFYILFYLSSFTMIKRKKS